MALRFLWKATVIARQRRTIVLSISCAGLFGANLTFHLFSKEMFKPLYQAWEHGKPLELSKEVQSLFHDILSNVGVKSVDNYEAIKTSTFHPVSAGLPWLPKRYVVGIPYYFSDVLNNKQRIPELVVLIEGNQVDWTSPEGLTLKDALTLSPEAQRFAIAREIVTLQHHCPLIRAAVSPTCLAGSYISGVAIKYLLGLQSAPLLLRGIYNMAVIAVGLVGYCLLYDTVSRALDYKVDRITASISPSFARGGVEFYDKVLSQNIIFRKLMSKQGEKMYAANGNLLPGFRLKHASFTSRRDLINKILNTSQS